MNNQENKIPYPFGGIPWIVLVTLFFILVSISSDSERIVWIVIGFIPLFLIPYFFFFTNVIDSLNTGVEIPCPVFVMFAACIIYILVFAGAYYSLNNLDGHGITLVNKASEKIPHMSFWKCIYFSTVTATTLGYGDYCPIGHGVILTSIQVILTPTTLIALLVSGMKKHSCYERFCEVKITE